MQDGVEPPDGIADWFDDYVISELSWIKNQCTQLCDRRQRDVALAAFSAIIVAVSKQDSETRYTRRNKDLKPGHTCREFARSLFRATDALRALNEEVGTGQSVAVVHSNAIEAPQIDDVDLVVCSPPYPNAFSYHLYHRTRMAWLDMDQQTFKRQEIGSHRKYSSRSKNAATKDTFKAEMSSILRWLALKLRLNRHACFVIGDSTIRGKTVHNDQLLCEIAEGNGYSVEANFVRELKATSKYFNPSIGRIRDEHIVVIRNTRRELS